MANLIPSWTWGDLDLTSPPFLFGFGSSLGAPATATEALSQLLLDGEIELGARASNRTLEFTVYIESTDLLASAEAERLLALEGDKQRNTLTYDPGDGYAPLTVFETFRAQVSFVRSDEAEMSGLRQYDVSMKAYPWPRSADLVETAALDTGETPVIATISAGDSLVPAYWEDLNAGALTDQGSFLRCPQFVSGGTGYAFIRYSAPAPVDTSSTDLVSLVMWQTVGGVEQSLPVAPSFPGGTFVGSQVTTGARRRYYWQVASASMSSFTFLYEQTPAGAALDFNSLQRTNVYPTIGTARQKQRAVAVEGSARTQGSLSVEHESSALGSTLVYTWPAIGALDYTPPMRARRVSGGAVTTDTSLVSGGRDLLDTALVYDVPVSELIAGTHLLMARLRSDTVSDQSVTYTAQLRQGSTNVGAATTGTILVPFGSTAWRNVVLARLMLPPNDVPAGSTAVVRITIVATTAGASNIDLDEAWLFNTSVGDLSWVECGTAAPAAGGSSNRLWLDAATTDVPRPTIYRGYAADRTDAFYPAATEVLSFGQHRFEPPLMNVFTVTSNALDAAVALEHYPRWQTHAAS